MPPSRPTHWPFRLTDRISGWFGGANPAEWLTVGSVSGGVDGQGHLGFAAEPGLARFGRDVFNNAGGR